MSGPTGARTLEYARGLGWKIGKVERWIDRVKKRIDLFGFADFVALDGLPGICFIQTTTLTNASSHLADMRENELVYDSLVADNRVLLICWRKLKYGKRKLWKPRVEALCICGDEVDIVFSWDRDEFADAVSSGVYKECLTEDHSSGNKEAMS